MDVSQPWHSVTPSREAMVIHYFFKNEKWSPMIVTQDMVTLLMQSYTIYIASRLLLLSSYVYKAYFVHVCITELIFLNQH